MVMNYALIGRETNLCRAELEAIAVEFTHLDENISLFRPVKNFDFKILGGSLAYGEALTKIKTDQKDIEDAIVKAVLSHIQPGENKVTFGISSYLPTNILRHEQLRQLEIKLKQSIRDAGRSVRFVSPQRQSRLSAAEVIYNKLAGRNGYEFVLFKYGSSVVLGKTLGVQDINAYTLRDRGKPCRDAKVGMLPPKLAQILLNLAKPSANDIIFDPFCGSGVVLIEAVWRGFTASGCDISSRMVACADENLTWAKNKLNDKTNFTVAEADATKLTKVPPNSVVVTETYLGEPMSQFPDKNKLLKNQKTTTEICLGFLERLGQLTKPGYRAIVCLPFWHDGKKNYTLDIIDQIRALGYTITRFSTSSEEELLYRRPDQIVGRQVLVLTRN